MYVLTGVCDKTRVFLYQSYLFNFFDNLRFFLNHQRYEAVVTTPRK